MRYAVFVFSLSFFQWRLIPLYLQHVGMISSDEQPNKSFGPDYFPHVDTASSEFLLLLTTPVAVATSSFQLSCQESDLRFRLDTPRFSLDCFGTICSRTISSSTCLPGWTCDSAGSFLGFFLVVVNLHSHCVISLSLPQVRFNSSRFSA